MIQKKMILEKARVETMLSRKLAKRPTKEELAHKNVLKDQHQDQESGTAREEIGRSLERFFSDKYSSRFSSGEIGEAIPLVNWAEEVLARAAEEEQSNSPRRSSTEIKADGADADSGSVDDAKKRNLKKPSPMTRELSMVCTFSPVTNTNLVFSFIDIFTAFFSNLCTRKTTTSPRSRQRESLCA